MAKNLTYIDWVESKHNETFSPLFSQIYDFDKTISNTLTTMNLQGFQAYVGREQTALMAQGFLKDALSSFGTNQTQLSFNLTAAVIDTLSAKLASLDTVPQAVTNKANAKGRRLADDLNYILKGLYHKYRLSHKINLAFKDAMINKVGYLKVTKQMEGDKLKDIEIERLYADEIIIDPSDGYYNDPYKIIHRKLVPLSAMIKLYPKFEDKLKDCDIIRIRNTQTQNYTPAILVAEGWCKNSFVFKGRHTIAVQSTTLVDEDWDKDYFPILKCDYGDPVIGWLGLSVVDELRAIQLEIDKILTTMQSILKLVSIPRIFIDTKSTVNTDHIRNGVGTIVEYDGGGGNAPIIHNGAAMPPELPKQLDFLIAQGYARVGLTQMDTQGQAPMGIESGEALKTMGDIKSERWQLLKKNFEAKHVELSEIILKEIAGHNLQLAVIDKHIGLRNVNTKLIPVKGDSYALQIFPESSLPSDPSGRIDTIERYVNMGVIDRKMVPDLLNLPDLGAQIAMTTAPRKYLELSLEEMLESGDYVSPEAYDDIDYALSNAVQHYSWERMNEKNNKKLVLLRRYINDCKALVAQRGVQPNGSNQPTAPSNSGTTSSRPKGA